jgi:hypothetical protein
MVVQNITLRSIYLHSLFRHAINIERCAQLHAGINQDLSITSGFIFL